MKSLLTSFILFFSITSTILGQQPFYNVSSGEGNGIRFWNNDRYKIHMGNSSIYHYGSVTDYSIRLNMNNDSRRGWTWGIYNTIPIAALNTQGKFQIANTFTANGGAILNGSILGNGVPILAINNTWRNYSGDYTLNRPFTIRRHNSNREAYFTYIQDGKTHFVYNNDEAASGIEFKLINTDTEQNGGANASSNVVMYMYSDRNGGRVRIGGGGRPDEKLVVDGKIVAEEVKVQNVPASDYVFEPDYALRPIQEVETFIQQNKHLPDIPSAEEFKKNGVGLGEMDDMLLRKVEELTLYVIELKKENEEMKRENAAMKEKDRIQDVEIQQLKTRQ